MNLRIAEIDLFGIRHGLQHRTKDQSWHKVRDIEGGLLFLDEFPDRLFGEFLADAVGDLSPC
jgi:hypothetical protein